MTWRNSAFSVQYRRRISRLGGATPDGAQFDGNHTESRVINAWKRKWGKLHQAAARQSHPVRWMASGLWARLLYVSGLCSLFTIDRGLYRVRFSRSAMSLAMWRAHDYWRQEEAFFRSRLLPGEFVIDVGANIGVNALLSAALVGPTGKVIAIEAYPQTFRYLQENIALNGFSNMVAYQYAIGANSGVTRFSRGLRDDSTNHVDEDGPIEVPLVSLDELLAEETREIDLLKVDVEGYERFVFAGASKTLARTKAIFFEVSERNFERFGYRTADVLQVLADCGFASYVVEGPGGGDRVRADLIPERRMNLIALRES